MGTEPEQRELSKFQLVRVNDAYPADCSPTPNDANVRGHIGQVIAPDYAGYVRVRPTTSDWPVKKSGYEWLFLREELDLYKPEQEHKA